MADVIATLHKRNDPDTNIYPNVKDTNIPDTILRVADLGKYVNLLTSININGDADYVSVTSDIGTFTTADITTLNVSGTADIEGKATFGSDVEVDGTLTVNSVSDIVTKDGSSFEVTGFSQLANDYYETDMIDRFYNAHVGYSFTASNGEKVRPLMHWDDYSTRYGTSPNGRSARFLWWEQTFSNQLYRYEGDSSTDMALLFPYFNDNARIQGLFSYPLTMYEGFNGTCYFCHFPQTNNAIQNLALGSVNPTKALPWVDEDVVYLPKRCEYMFANCASLTEIGAFDASNSTVLANIFGAFGYQADSALKSVHITHFKVSFNINVSTQFEEADLVEIIGNLDTVSTPQTLTMGSTNLAKLTQDEILVATGRGWTLA